MCCVVFACAEFINLNVFVLCELHCIVGSFSASIVKSSVILCLGMVPGFGFVAHVGEAICIGWRACCRASLGTVGYFCPPVQWEVCPLRGDGCVSFRDEGKRGGVSYGGGGPSMMGRRVFILLRGAGVCVSFLRGIMGAGPHFSCLC